MEVCVEKKSAAGARTHTSRTEGGFIWKPERAGSVSLLPNELETEINLLSQGVWSEEGCKTAVFHNHLVRQVPLFACPPVTANSGTCPNSLTQLTLTERE